MTAMSEWGDWEALWRTNRLPAPQLEHYIEHTKRARRTLRLMRVLSAVLALAALGVVGAALRHAGNAIEIALGVVVGLGICAVWILDVVNQRRAHDSVEVPANQYVAVRRALCLRQLRFARLVLTVTLLDLVFLVPWWIGGFRFHGAGFHTIQLLTMWGPLALMIAVGWWAIRLRGSARAELGRLGTAEPL
jgi:hypothetical protein